MYHLPLAIVCGSCGRDGDNDGTIVVTVNVGFVLLFSFHLIGPLDRFDLEVAMPVCLCVCLCVCVVYFEAYFAPTS